MKEMELKNYTAKKEKDLLIELMLNNCIIEEPIETLMINHAEEVNNLDLLPND